jgi:NitT/TauT family transport system permease protein
MKHALAKLVFFAALLGLWQGVAWLEIWPDYLFPSPTQVADTLLHGLVQDHYLSAILASMRRLALGYAVSLLIGLGIGILLAASRLAEETLGSLILGLQNLPSVCWLPLALLWFGLSDRAILFVIVAGSVLSISMAAKAGIRQVPSLWTRAGRNMGASGVKLYLYVVLPAALPTLVSGMRQGWAFAWRSLMAAELLFVTLGLGQLMNMGRELNDMSQVVSVMLIIIAIGTLTDRLLFSWIDRKLALSWGFKSG